MEPEGQFLGQKRGVFSTFKFTDKDPFLFHKSKLFIMASSIQKYPPIHVGKYVKSRKLPFLVKLLITLTCCNSLINPVISKFYFEILIRVTNVTGCESLIEMNDDKVSQGRTSLSSKSSKSINL